MLILNIFLFLFQIPRVRIHHVTSCRFFSDNTWWRHQMETFSALLAICAGNSPVPGEFPTQRPVTRSFDVYFDLRPDKRLSKQSWGWWFETLSHSLWRHRNDPHKRIYLKVIITTHMLSIERAGWPKLHDMFKARDAKTRQRKFPVGFPLSVWAITLLFSIFHDVVANIESKCVI